jgi:hypothetical protein
MPPQLAVHLNEEMPCLFAIRGIALLDAKAEAITGGPPQELDQGGGRDDLSVFQGLVHHGQVPRVLNSIDIRSQTNQSVLAGGKSAVRLSEPSKDFQAGL